MRSKFENIGFEYLFSDAGGVEVLRRQTKLGVATMGAGVTEKPCIQLTLNPDGKANISISEIFVDRPIKSTGFSNHVALASIDDIDIETLFKNLSDYERRVVDAFVSLT